MGSNGHGVPPVETGRQGDWAMRRRKPVEPQPVWFFKDQAIRQVDDDHLDHQAVAAALVKAVEAADPPCMIGLMAEFGMGKSSTANLASSMLKASGQYDTVTVSADKHSGHARSRNIVHSIAAELEDYPKIDANAVHEILRPIRQSTQVAVSDPTDTAFTRFGKGRYSYAGLAGSLMPFAVVAVVIGVLAWLSGAELHELLTVAAASPVLIWLAAMTFTRTDSPVGVMLKPATLTDLKPRAEAADEIEEVFGQLVDYHRNKRKRQLVVFIDDIDRLNKDGLLDALRALRSLQSVPRKREPIFVISCNEKIVQRAVGDSVNAPAGHMPNHQVALTNGESETKESDPSVMDSDSPKAAQQGTSVSGEHDHPAVAFVDKLLTVRVHMPPTMRGDMRRFARDIVRADHPLRSDPKIDLDRILTILVHDGVEEPRSVIRLLNRFVAAYILGSEREGSGRVYSGDVTHHLDVLAQLAVILDEFPDFHEEIVGNSVLLSAASKVALGDENLTPSEIDAVARSTAFEDTSSPTGGREFRQPTLGRYLASTARLVRYPADVAPLVYFAASPSTRLLGAELRNSIVSALRVGNPVELGSVLSAVPSDLTDAAGEEIADIIGQAIPVDTPNILAAVAPNLSVIGDTAAMVADACADLLDRTPDDLPPPATITHLLDHSDPGRYPLLCDRLVRHDEDTVPTSARMAHAASYLAARPQVRERLEPAILEWITEMHTQGGWELAKHWLNVAETLKTDEHAHLLELVVSAMTRMIRTEQDFTREHADRFVALTERVPNTGVVPRGQQIASSGPNVMSALVRIWKVVGHEGDADDASFAADAITTSTLDLAERILAIELVSRWVDEWKEATRQSEDDGETDVAREILDTLLESISEPDLIGQVCLCLPQLADALEYEAEDLVQGVANRAMAFLDDDQVEQAESIAISVVQALGYMPSETVNEAVRTLLEPILSESDPTSAAVQMSRRIIPRVARLDNGEQALETEARRWADRIMQAGAHDDRSLIEGFRALKEAAPQIVTALAQQVYSQVNNYLHDDYGRTERLRVLATFPWNDDGYLSNALERLDEHWEAVPEDDRHAVFQLVPRDTETSAVVGRFHERLVTAVESDPSGRTSAVATKELHRMSSEQRGKVFTAATGIHSSVTASLKECDNDEIGSILAVHSNDESIGRLLDAVPSDRRTEVSRVALITITETDSVPDSIIGNIADSCDQDGLQQAAEAALASLPSSNSAAESALRVYRHAIDRGSQRDKRRVNQLVTEMLPEATETVANLLGRATHGQWKLSNQAYACLRQLRENESQAHLAAVFDSARNEGKS